MQTGIIKKWDHSSGWGFIEGDDGEDYFFNISNIRKGQMIKVGINVKFDSIPNANHFYKGKEKELANSIEGYIKDKITIV